MLHNSEWVILLLLPYISKLLLVFGIHLIVAVSIDSFSSLLGNTGKQVMFVPVIYNSFRLYGRFGNEVKPEFRFKYSVRKLSGKRGRLVIWFAAQTKFAKPFGKVGKADI